jgi:hypothetical protein
MVTVLIGNAFQRLDELNSRLAVVEAVAAIDAYIRFYLHRLILTLPNTEPILLLIGQIRETFSLPDNVALTSEDVKRFLENKGLRGTFDDVLRALANEIQLKFEDLNHAREAINERNQILHLSKRIVDLQEARKYVRAIDRVLATLRRVTLQNE